jgi:hypothetical protein
MIQVNSTVLAFPENRGVKFTEENITIKKAL